MSSSSNDGLGLHMEVYLKQKSIADIFWKIPEICRIAIHSNISNISVRRKFHQPYSKKLKNFAAFFIDPFVLNEPFLYHLF